MSDGRKKIILNITVIAVLVGLLVPLQGEFNKSKGISGGEKAQVNPITSLPPADFIVGYIGSLFLGGLKSLAVDYLWIKYIQLEEDKQFEEALVVLKLIADLNPYLEDVWIHNAHNMIYNIPVLKDTPAEQWLWIDNGLTYAEDGLKWNPHNRRIEEWLGFFYYHKIPSNIKGEYKARQFIRDKRDCYDMAAEWYRRASADIRAEWPDYAYKYDMVAFDCMQKRVFHMIEGNLVYDGKNNVIYRFESAPAMILEAKKAALDFGRSIVPTYKDKCVIGEAFVNDCVDSFAALDSAFNMECALIEAKGRKDFDEYMRILTGLSAEYVKVVKSYPGVYQSEVNKRVVTILKQAYILPAFEKLNNDPSVTGKVIEAVKNAQDFCESVYDKEKGQMVVWHEYAYEFSLLNDILRAEAGAAIANNSRDALMQAMEAAEKAIDKYPNTVVTELYEARKREIEKKLFTH